MNQEMLDFVKVYVTHNQVAPEALPNLLLSLQKVFEGSVAPEGKQPYNINDTVFDDYIVCLEDGRHMKILRRHLQQAYGMTAEEYRAKWGLPSDYPMVAKTYSKQRSTIAKGQGLGKKST